MHNFFPSKKRANERNRGSHGRAFLSSFLWPLHDNHKQPLVFRIILFKLSFLNSKFVKNTPLRVMFAILFSVFGNVMKHPFSCLMYYVKVRVHFRTNPYLKFSFFHRAVDSGIETVLVPRNFPGRDQGWGRQRKPGHNTEQEKNEYYWSWRV